MDLTSLIGAGRKSSPECEYGHVIVRLFLLYSYSINIIRTWLWLIPRPALDQLSLGVSGVNWSHIGCGAPPWQCFTAACSATDDLIQVQEPYDTTHPPFLVHGADHPGSTSKALLVSYY